MTLVAVMLAVTDDELDWLIENGWVVECDEHGFEAVADQSDIEQALKEYNA